MIKLLEWIILKIIKYNTTIPKKDLAELGIKPHSKRDFILANGEKIVRQMGDAIFKYQGMRGAATVIFGEKGDSLLLGATTLESLGVILDPLQRVLKPLPMVL